MNKIKTEALKVGDIFSAPVYTEGEHLLVSALVPLRQKEIDFLKRLKIEEVSTEGFAIATEETTGKSAKPEKSGKNDKKPKVSKNELSGNKKVVMFSIADVKKNSTPYRQYRTLIDKLDSVFNAIKSGADVDMRSIDNISLQLVNDLNNNPNNFVDYILGGEITGHELAKSSVNTAILSALTAQELKLPNHKVINIVGGALLHDIGMFRLSKGITEKKGGLSDAELEQIKSHPTHSSKIVSKELFGPHEVNLIALHHHERWDGQGYPDKLAGHAIDIGARIVSVADAFEAMVSKKSYRNSMVGYQAIKNLMADNARRFDPDVIIAFTKIMGIYPIGSIVRLNDDSVARVVSVQSTAPLRPVVHMLIDSDGCVIDPDEAKTVDLLAQKSLFIKNAIDPKEFEAE